MLRSLRGGNYFQTRISWKREIWERNGGKMQVAGCFHVLMYSFRRIPPDVLRAPPSQQPWPPWALYLCWATCWAAPLSHNHLACRWESAGTPRQRINPTRPRPPSSSVLPRLRRGHEVTKLCVPLKIEKKKKRTRKTVWKDEINRWSVTKDLSTPASIRGAERRPNTWKNSFGFARLSFLVVRGRCHKWFGLVPGGTACLSVTQLRRWPGAAQKLGGRKRIKEWVITGRTLFITHLNGCFR